MALFYRSYKQITFRVLCLALVFLILIINYRDNLYFKHHESIGQGSRGTVLSNLTPSDNENDITSALTKEKVASGELRLTQDDKLLLDFIRLHHLKLPGAGKVDLSSIDDGIKKEEQQEVFRFIIQTLQNKTGGFFIECGASDGEFYSNTLQLELDFNWTGLLIEADPRPLTRLLKRNRHAWVANACLSTTSYPKKIEMLRNDKSEGLSFIPGYMKFLKDRNDYYQFEAQCFPLYSILKSINVTTIDYFSLDIEGAELDVLKTIPWESVFIKMFSIEVHPQYVQPVKDYMASVGYDFLTFIQNGYSHDQIYIRKNL